MNQKTTLRCDAHDTSNLLVHAFLDESPRSARTRHVKAVLLDTFVQSTHFRGLSTTTYLFPAALAGTQLVEDIRFEERIALKEIAQDRAQEKLEDVDASGVEQRSDLRTSPSAYSRNYLSCMRLTAYR